MPKQNSKRSGAYINQLTGYKAFIPASLPPNPELKIDLEMQTLLSKADRALGRLDGSIQTLPNPDLFVLMYVRKEAVLSSQIEGTQSSLNDVLDAEANIMDARRPNDVAEVINYIDALKFGLEKLNELPVSTRLIKLIHEKLMDGVRGQEKSPGEIRQTQNWIGPEGCTLNTATFVPPPPHELNDALSRLEQFIHDESEIPLLIKIGLIHAQFETIHPFLDGNGRVGRLLITFLLCQAEILVAPVLYISHYFKSHRSEYYEKLQAIRDNGEWEEWIKFFLTGIHTVSNEATETARDIVTLREEHRQILATNFGRGTANAIKLLEQLYRTPVVDVGVVANFLDMTHAGANQLVAKFEEAGILHEVTGQSRNRAFRYSKYVNLF
jgi:Fic family protein